MLNLNQQIMLMIATRLMGRMETVFGGDGDSCTALIVQLEDITAKRGNVHTLARSFD